MKYCHGFSLFLMICKFVQMISIAFNSAVELRETGKLGRTRSEPKLRSPLAITLTVYFSCWV